MAGRPSLRLQSSAQRFRLRRMDYAVLGRRPPLERDPLGVQRLAMLTGAAVTAGALVLTAVVAAGRVDSGPGDAPLVMSRQSGALFVRVDGQLRPVANVASARLILGSAEVPRLVDESFLGDVTSGPVLGIPAAPRSLGRPIASATIQWAVCDDADAATTIAVSEDPPPRPLEPNEGVVVSATPGDGSVYLLYDGKRAIIDPGDPATARALHLDGVSARKVSAAVLNAIPEVPGIAPPRITGMGQPSGAAGHPVGTVLRVARADSPEYYLVLAAGLQRVGRLAADLVRFSDPAAGAQILTVAPGLIAGSPLLDALPVGAYPEDPPALRTVGDGLCATWAAGRSGIALDLPSGDRPAVALAGSDGAGPGIDFVRVPPGRTVDITATMLTTDRGAVGRYLVTDAGVRFPIHDSAAATALGLGPAGSPAPWTMIGALPAGPELSRESALVARDIGAAP